MALSAHRKRVVGSQERAARVGQYEHELGHLFRAAAEAVEPGKPRHLVVSPQKLAVLAPQPHAIRKHAAGLGNQEHERYPCLLLRVEAAEGVALGPGGEGEGVAFFGIDEGDVLPVGPYLLLRGDVP